jgi:hypothetical protein
MRKQTTQMRGKERSLEATALEWKSPMKIRSEELMQEGNQLELKMSRDQSARLTTLYSILVRVMLVKTAPRSHQLTKMLNLTTCHSKATLRQHMQNQDLGVRLTQRKTLITLNLREDRATLNLIITQIIL